MKKVIFNNKTLNPFNGLTNCLQLFKNSNSIISETLLNNAFNEVKKDKEKRKLFYSLLFSIGDITNREHNIFKGKKVDSGGNANRESFITIVNWMRENDYQQFKKFLFNNLFIEYNCLDTLLINRVKTIRRDTTVIKVYSSLKNCSNNYLEDLADYFVGIIKGNNILYKQALAKFLTRPRTSKRSKHKNLLEQTKIVAQYKVEFMKILSQKANFEVVQKDKFLIFKGYNDWKKNYINNLESYLFSLKEILNFDKQEFLLWLDSIPASARHRVKCKLYQDKTSKWKELPEWFQGWEQYKEVKQNQQRILEEKVRQGNTSSSLLKFFDNCNNLLGFKPSVAANGTNNIEKFEGNENFLNLPPNPAQIEQLLTNCKDMEVFDIYTPLNSLYKSNRYEPIRNCVL